MSSATENGRLEQLIAAAREREAEQRRILEEEERIRKEEERVRQGYALLGELARDLGEDWCCASDVRHEQGSWRIYLALEVNGTTVHLEHYTDRDGRQWCVSVPGRAQKYVRMSAYNPRAADQLILAIGNLAGL
jgi:hypothetical protein